MNLSYLVLAAGLAIGAVNLRPTEPASNPSQHPGTTWPTEFEGRPLLPLPLSGMESSFAKSFPGAIARFRCGEDEVILRRVRRATRKLHDSATCLRAAGFHIEDQSIDTQVAGGWSVYTARRSGQILDVREHIRSASQTKLTWTDVSQWFWHAAFHPDDGPWMAVTVLSER